MRYFWILTFLCSVCWNNSTGQNRDSNQVDFAKGQHLQFEYEIFKCSDKKCRNKYLFQKAKLYKMNQNYLASYHSLLRMEVQPTDTFFEKVTYELALSAFLTEKYQESYSHLIELYHFIPQSTNNQDYNFLRFNLLCTLEKWEILAEEIVSLSIRMDKDTSWVREFLEREMPKLKNPKKAQILSMIVPGSGQIYAGQIKSGGVSFLLNAGAVYFGVTQFITQHYITTAFSGLGFSFSFYRGGFRQAENAVEDYNKEKTEIFKLSLIKELENRFF